MEHPYRKKKSRFNGQEENREKPMTIISDYIIENGEKIMQIIKECGICVSKNDQLNDSGVKIL